jgi:hypothetical protein
MRGNNLHKFFLRLLCLIVILFFSKINDSFAQRHEQLWFDFQLDYPFGGQYLFETTASYQTLLSSEDKWRNVNVTPTFEFMGFRRLDFTFDLPVGYTMQVEGVNSFELVPTLGLRFHLSQNRRIDSRIFARLEERFFYQIEDDDWDRSNRFRLKGEAFVAINRPNIFTDNLWYAIIDYEEFFVVDQQVKERYANRRRGRIGLGYRMDYKNRFEIIYTRQSSKNELEGEFISGDNVIQLRYKIFFNPATSEPDK